MYETIIISRHQAAIDWLKEQGIDGKVIAHATSQDVDGKIVYGNLPLHLAALAAVVYTIELPHLPRNARGNELTLDEMYKYGAHLTKYFVREADESSTLCPLCGEIWL